MMSILMLGLISAGGGVGVATFAQDQQGGLTQTTGGAGLREAVTIENVEIELQANDSVISVTIRNTGSVDVDLGTLYFDGKVGFNYTGIDEENLKPGSSVTTSFTLADNVLDAGSKHSIKVTTEGGGAVVTQATVPQISNEGITG